MKTNRNEKSVVMCLLAKLYKRIRDIMNIKNIRKEISLTMHAKAMYQIT